jgi:hypothetical protein
MATVQKLAAAAGAALVGAVVMASPAAATEDPGCAMFGWRHPLCAGGAFDSPGDNAAEGGIPAPSMVPNVNGTLSPPGTPGTI